MKPLRWIAILGLLFAGTLRADVAQAIKTIHAVKAEGGGNVAASAAWNELSAAGMDAIPAILAGMEGANPIAANYLRAAIDTIVQRETAAGKALPLPALGELLMDQSQDVNARAVAFDLIQQSQPATAEKLVPGLLSDPSVHLRRLAVTRLIKEGQALAAADDKPGAGLLYRQALGAARDTDQVSDLAKKLRELKEEVDLPKHFGFLMHWNVVAPFDNTERKGFETAFDPEKGPVDLAAAYPGKTGEVKWQPLVTSDEYGKVDFNKPYGNLKEVTGYAYTEFNAAQAQPAELRLGCKNAWKIWLNGEFVFGRDEYHRGQRIDQYRLPIQLKAGKNTILVKCCQNEQTQDWTVQWEYQLRVCDSTGTAILATDRLPTPKAEATRRRPVDAPAATPAPAPTPTPAPAKP